MADRENCSKCGKDKKIKNLNLVKGEWICSSCMGGDENTRTITGNKITGGFINFGTTNNKSNGWW